MGNTLLEGVDFVESKYEVIQSLGYSHLKVVVCEGCRYQRSIGLLLAFSDVVAWSVILRSRESGLKVAFACPLLDYFARLAVHHGSFAV